MVHRTGLKHAMVGAVLGGALAAGGMLVASSAPAASSGIAYHVVTRDVSVPAGQARAFDLRCPGGMVPVGGGGHYGINSFLPGSASGAYVSESDLDLSGRGWETSVVAYSGAPTAFTIHTVCAAL